MQRFREEQKEIRRANRRKKRITEAKEKQLSLKNAYGVKDPTPYEAVKEIINN